MAGLQPASAISGAALSGADAPAAEASIEWTLFCSVSTKQLAAGGNGGGEFTQANAIRVAGLDRIFLSGPSFVFAYSSLYSDRVIDSGNCVGVHSGASEYSPQLVLKLVKRREL